MHDWRNQNIGVSNEIEVAGPTRRARTYLLESSKSEGQSSENERRFSPPLGDIDISNPSSIRKLRKIHGKNQVNMVNQ